MNQYKISNKYNLYIIKPHDKKISLDIIRCVLLIDGFCTVFDRKDVKNNFITFRFYFYFVFLNGSTIKSIIYLRTVVGFYFFFGFYWSFGYHFYKPGKDDRCNKMTIIT